MEFKKGQVKVLANTNTGRETFVDLNDVVLFPNTDKEVTLGNYLEKLSNESTSNKKEVASLKKIVKHLIGVITELNLK